MNPVRFGMIGGGGGAFIGAVHRTAMRLDGRCRLVAGALASTPERALASAREIGLPDDRAYPDWRTMLGRELQRPEDQRIEAVAIVTPNHTHAALAGACLDAGLHVVLDKPMVTSSAEAAGLREALERSGRTLTVTYNYSGYPMVREARARLAAGVLGSVRRVIVEYLQGWLADDLEATGQKQAAWRTDPARSGGAGALGDIGTHAEHLARFITGLSPMELCAQTRSFVPGRQVDDDAGVLLRYEGGASGTLTCSQVCRGQENGLSIRVFGERGSLAWRQEEPNRLDLWDAQGAYSLVTRGSPLAGEHARLSTRLPAGHPEGFIEAFANIYLGAADRIRGIESPMAELAPTLLDGAAGVRFIEAALKSRGVWVRLV